MRSVSYLNAIADAAEIKKGDTVLEIGPGEGTLTAVLLERGARVIAVEKDARLTPVLTGKFAGKKFELVEGDALEFEPAFKNYKVVGNIPYYITGALLKKFLSGEAQPTTLVFLIQKEVAERIARSKKESVLSLSVKAYGEPKYIKMVPRGAFAPAPKVDSAILRVTNISRKNFKNKKHEARFFELIKKGFGQKRKVLKNTLGDIGSLAQERPEDLLPAQWLKLALES